MLRGHRSAAAQSLQGGHGSVRQGHQHHGASRRLVRSGDHRLPAGPVAGQRRNTVPNCRRTTSTSAASSACFRAAGMWPTSACSIRSPRCRRVPGSARAILMRVAWMIPEADYMQVGEALSLGVRRDFTFVHPEVLEERCAVEGATITLNNKVNRERWRVFIIPGFALHQRRHPAPHQAILRPGRHGHRHHPLAGSRGRTRCRCRGPPIGGGDFRPGRHAAGDAPRITASSTWAGGGYDPAMTMDGGTQTRWNAADGNQGCPVAGSGSR